MKKREDIKNLATDRIWSSRQRAGIEQLPTDQNDQICQVRLNVLVKIYQSLILHLQVLIIWDLSESLGSITYGHWLYLGSKSILISVVSTWIQFLFSWTLFKNIRQINDYYNIACLCSECSFYAENDNLRFYPLLSGTNGKKLIKFQLLLLISSCFSASIINLIP